MALEHRRAGGICKLCVAQIAEIIAPIPVRLAGKDQNRAAALTTPETGPGDCRINNVIIAPVAVQIGKLNEARPLKQLFCGRFGTVGNFVHGVGHFDWQTGVSGSRTLAGDPHPFIAPRQQQATHTTRIALHRLDHFGSANLRAVIGADKDVIFKRLQVASARPSHEHLVLRHCRPGS